MTAPEPAMAIPLVAAIGAVWVARQPQAETPAPQLRLVHFADADFVEVA